MPSFATQQSLFRAYDIRGSHQHFTTDFIQALGHAFAHLYHASHRHPIQCNLKNNALMPNMIQNTDSEQIIVVIGYDVRCGSDTIAQKLATILTQCGIQVIQLGLITTPMMVFWAEQHQGHGIVVTASHSAKDILGIKWLVNHQSPSSTEIQGLYQQLLYQKLNGSHLNHSAPQQSNIQKSNIQKSCLQKDNKAQNKPLSASDALINNHQMHLSAEQVATTYIDAIVQVFKQLYPYNNQASITHTTDSRQTFSKLDLVVVIDCMHGATSNIAQHLFERFCQHVIMLNDIPDGHFPTGNPDPTEPHRLKQLQQSVVTHQADIGIAFDGDGDRLMIVDNNGKVVTPDHLLYLLAQVALTERPEFLTDSQLPSQILFDIKCCHHLPKLITELGATAVMSKTGSSLIRRRLQQSNNQIIFAGELSGHFIFNDGYFILYDDAMYAALRLLHWLGHTANSDKISPNLAIIIHGLPVIVSTADHYLPLPETALTDCSIVERLIRLCLYLQQLIKATSLTSTHTEHQPIIDCAVSECTCSAKKPYITLQQAQYLLPVGTKLSCIDGVRLDFAHGFGVLRQSNTSHNLTARFAGDSIEDLKDIQAKFAALCHPFDEDLAAQIMAIPPE
ncbi:phosphomannomutase [Psychrobacter sp. DAB_AL32B]|uniref:phosphomannomutase n=1 Tax=Psychrobacter sp. DAB_AL32B TaxID=1028414 RepID=UPI000B7E6BAA|nr:phosphomannomutase [Psychrobacter sp. DAB_AL32B]OXL18763.1 phosphomannomutase [Psychrobacter sp. DAB_AL32B]